MVIPLNENFILFYLKSRKYYLGIKSRYKGVYILYEKKVRVNWYVNVMIRGKKYRKRFPFTMEGEIMARDYYIEVTNNFNK